MAKTILDLMDAKLLAQEKHNKRVTAFMLEFMAPQQKMAMAAIYKSMPDEAKQSLSKKQRERIEKVIGG